jgi:phosphate transport system permease protein
MQPKPFTGRTRQRRTSRSVFWAERTARVLIAAGGIGTILAVTTVFVFLAAVVVPLFRPAGIDRAATIAFPAGPDSPPEFLATDEYQLLGLEGLAGGARVRVFTLGDGRILEERELFEGAVPTALSFWPIGGQIAAGFSDGTVRIGRIGFEASFLPEDARLSLAQGQVQIHEGGVVELTPEGQLRRQSFASHIGEPVPLPEAGPVALVDYTVTGSGPVVAAVTAEGTFHVFSVSQRKNLLTGEVITSTVGGALALPSRPGPVGGALPSRLLLSGVADTAYLFWENGHVVRVDTRRPWAPVVAEERDLWDEPGVRLTALSFLIGKTTIVTGDSRGRVRTWFRVRADDAQTSDGTRLVLARELREAREADISVTALAPSFRRRILAAGFADGRVDLFHVTSARLLGEVLAGTDPVAVLALSPKDEAFAAQAGAELSLWRVNAPHPETTLSSLFRPVRYEGAEHPAHVWQSSSGTDDFEPKYGLVPLIFGTLKATFYSLLLGAPLALLAAIYTSEFLHPRSRARIKPAVELMASLPSVVLGFLAALVFAPFVAEVVPSVLTAFFTVPLAFLAAAYLVQLLPRPAALWAGRWRFALLLLGALPAGLWGARLLGPAVERWLFEGNLKAWLAGQAGTGAPGWFLMLLPLAAVAVGAAVAKLVTPRLRPWLRNLERHQAARFECAKFALGGLATLALAWLLAQAVTGAGFDSRDPFPGIGPVLGTYVQRNSLVVGFVMGFAIIPIIYTLAEDALSSVPGHLRGASLAAGATPWQTAVRVVLPTAASGLFSALMIGLGRAVGETMIVLMAAGNTPILEWNIFNGFRTLSANIAVELPEAVVGSTHYRTLFLAALTLFLMTFVINTVAETVRLRFRKRAFEL